MEKKKQSLSITALIWKGLFFAVLGIVFLTGKEFATNQTIKEGRLITQELGEDTALYIRDKADAWFDEYIVVPGVEESVVNFFVPTKEEAARSRGMENMGKGLFAWAEERISVLFDLVYWVFKRFALLLIWLPLLIPLFVVSVTDGIFQRNIKKQNFDLASPLWQKFGTVGIVGTVCSLLLLFCIPISIAPISVPILLAIISVLTGISVGNVQKRL